MLTYLKYINFLCNFPVILVLLQVGCANTDSSFKYNQSLVGDAPIIHINLDSQVTFVSIDKIFSDAFFLTLEEDSINRIGTIDKVIISDTFIYILDKTFYSVKLFNHKGKYLSTIGGLSTKSSKYHEFTDFFIDTTQKKLVVLANNPKETVLNFTMEGMLLSKFNLGVYPTSFAKQDRSLFVYIDGKTNEKSKNYNLLEFSLNEMEFQNNRFMSSQLKASFAFTGFLKNGNNCLLYANPFSDTIFQIKEYKISPKYIINGIPKEEFQNNEVKANNEDHFRNFSRYYLTSKIFEDSLYLITEIQLNSSRRFNIYDKLNHISIQPTRDETDLANLISVPVGLNKEGYFISSLNSKNYSSIVTELKSQYWKKQNLHFTQLLLNEIKENKSSSVLIFFKVNRQNDKG